MNRELGFQVRQAHYQDLLKEAEQHRLWSKARKARKERKSQAAEKKQKESLDGSKTWREALEGTS